MKEFIRKVSGWLVFCTLLEHYWWHKIYIIRTQVEHIFDMVFFQHHYIKQKPMRPFDVILNPSLEHWVQKSGKYNCKRVGVISSIQQNNSQSTTTLITKVPFKSMCQMANAVWDDKSGKMFECWHLLQHPKYHEAWSLLAAIEYGRLVQGVGN